MSPLQALKQAIGKINQELKLVQQVNYLHATDYKR